MIVIADDTLNLNQYPFLSEEKYNSICKVYTKIKTSDLRNLKYEAENSALFCYHKSLRFFNSQERHLDVESNKNYRENLIKTVKNKVSFSGGADNNNIKLRELKKDEFYKNLKSFLDLYVSTKTIDLETLFFGSKSLSTVEKVQSSGSFFTKNNFVFTAKESEDANFSFREITDFTNKKIHQILLRNLNDIEYENIYIPLNFTDYFDCDGLRFATHIRCTKIKNQLKNIYVYGTSTFEQLIDNEFFDILKTKNVFYIDYNKRSLLDSENKQTENFKDEELSSELRKLNIKAPEGNHTIANKWAIYRWSKILDISDEAITKNFSGINYSLYFKYLQTIYPIHETEKIKKEEFIIQGIENKKILYIDDEAEKGWSAIFKHIFNNVNNFDYLKKEVFSGKSQDEIIETCLDKIVGSAENRIKGNADIDIVILDFRLHQDDFLQTDFHEITGLKVLKRIKEYNPGIQVIIFSATNKIWNLQSIMKIGADGFIMKESVENSSDRDFTKLSLQNLVSNIDTSLKMSFLKKAFLEIKTIKSNVQNLILGIKSFIVNDFEKEIITYLDLGFELLNHVKNDSKYFNYAYIQFFLIIELIGKSELFVKEESGGDYVTVMCGNEEVLIQQPNGKTLQRSLKFSGNNKYEFGNITIQKKENQRIDTNFRISALLIFRFGNVNSSVEKWPTIRDNRNSKAAHYDKNHSKNNINKNDIFDILSFINYLTNRQNIKNSNSEKGLKQKSFDDALKELANDPRVKK